MKWLLVLLFLVVLVGIYNNSLAHFPKGVTFIAVGIPDKKLPKIDGDLSDWDWVPAKYIIGNGKEVGHRMYNIEKMGHLSYDENVKILVGWNKRANKLYFAVEHKDKEHRVFSIEEPFYHDRIEIMIDADHSGGQYSWLGIGVVGGPFIFPWDLKDDVEKNREGAQATMYYMGVPNTIGGRTFTAWNAGDWMNVAPWVEYAWKMEPGSGGESIITYEIAIVPFDDLNWVGPEESKLHYLKEGEIVGLSTRVVDYGVYTGISTGIFSVSSAAEAFYKAQNLSDFLLVSPEEDQTISVRSTTWARIKSVFYR